LNRFQEFMCGLHPFLLSSIASVLTVAQIVLAVFLRRPGSEALEWAGWICLWTSAIFGVLPIITFRRKGSVPEGDSYMKTTVLVDTGIYAIVRHPQGGTAWLLINLGVLLIAQHWSSVTLGLASLVLVYVDTFKADQSNRGPAVRATGSGSGDSRLSGPTEAPRAKRRGSVKVAAQRC